MALVDTSVAKPGQASAMHEQVEATLALLRLPLY